MKRMITLLVLLSLISCSRGTGTLDSGNIVHAAEPPAKWFKTEIPLTVFHDEQFSYARAMGFWQSTNTNEGRQLVFPIAAQISCDRKEKICREANASVQLGILEPELIEYEISSWTHAQILADDTDTCNRHSLAIDFKSNSVTVTDYPIKNEPGDSTCKPLAEANSYALHGGQLQLYPPAPWNPLEKPVGKK